MVSLLPDLMIFGLTKYTIEEYIDYIHDSKSSVFSLEYSYHKAEYGELFDKLPDYNVRYSEEFLKYTEMALVYRTYEKYTFWNEIENRCESDDKNKGYYEKFRVQYLEDLSKKMKALKYEENRRVMNKIIDEANIELIQG